MQKRLVPISSDIDTDIHHWLGIYQPFFDQQTYQTSGHRLVTDILQAALRAFCTDKGYLSGRQCRTGLSAYEYPTLNDFWLYTYSLRNISSAIIYNHGTLPEQLRPTTTKDQLHTIFQFINSHHNRERQVLNGFQAAFVATDRAVYHYDGLVPDQTDAE